MVKQETTVEDYLEKYEALASPLCNLPDAVMEGAFMNRLKSEVQVEVRMMKPTNLAQMIEVAQLVEERNKVPYLGWAGVGGPWVKNTKPAPSQPSLGPFAPCPK